jgi:hypothetical protein
MPDMNVNKVFVIIPKLLLDNLLHFLVRISMSMLGPTYQTWDMKMYQELALHPWIQSWIVGGGTDLFNIRAISLLYSNIEFDNGELDEDDRRWCSR